METTLAEPSNDTSNPSALALGQTSSTAITVAAPEERLAFTRSKGIPFTGAQIAKATADLPENHRVMIRWLYAHGMDKGDDLARLAKRIRKNYTTVYRIFKGEYGANVDKFVLAIEEYKRVSEERDKVGRPPFIPTSLSAMIWDRCHDALTFQKLAPIIGEWQIGKSFAAEAYMHTHNHGQTRLVRLPSGSAYKIFLQEFAKACYAPHKTDLGELREGILNSLDSGHLVIFDEIDEPLAGRFSTGALQIYGFIREVFDRRKCGMVFIGNTNFRTALSESGPFGPWMAKLRRRCLPTLDLPTTAPDEDLWALAGHYGLTSPANGEALDLARLVVRKEGLGEYVTLLQTAKKISITLGVPIHWDHFTLASAQIGVTASGGDEQEGGR